MGASLASLVGGRRFARGDELIVRVRNALVVTIILLLGLSLGTVVVRSGGDGGGGGKAQPAPSGPTSPSSTGRGGRQPTQATTTTATTAGPTSSTEVAAPTTAPQAATTSVPGSGLAASGAGHIEVGPTTPRTGGLPLAVPGLLVLIAGALGRVARRPAKSEL